MTTKLTDHFTLDEFLRSDAAKKLGDANEPSMIHLDNLGVTARGMEQVRLILSGRSCTITSGYRNPRVNKSVGGVPNSDHAIGFACDFRVAGLTPLQAGRAIERSALSFDQLIHEVSRGILHISFNPRMRRQVLTQRGGPGTPFIKGLHP